MSRSKQCLRSQVGSTPLACMANLLLQETWLRKGSQIWLRVQPQPGRVGGRFVRLRNRTLPPKVAAQRTNLEWAVRLWRASPLQWRLQPGRRGLPMMDLDQTATILR